MIIEQVTDRAYANIMGESLCNLGAVVLPNHAIVIDSGMYPPITEEFRSYFERKARTKVTKLILTHSHADHVFGNQIFRDCQIISSRSLADQMLELSKTQWTRGQLEEAARIRPEIYGNVDLDALRITFPTEVFDDSLEIIDEGFKVKVERVGGHSEDSSYAYFPEDKVLFAGDLIFAKMFPWGGDPTADPDMWITALKKFLDMRVEKVIPGHGPICDMREVQIYLDFFDGAVKIIREMIAEGKSQEEVVNFDGYPEFYASETVERWRDSLSKWYQVCKMKST